MEYNPSDALRDFFASVTLDEYNVFSVHAMGDLAPSEEVLANALSLSADHLALSISEMRRDLTPEHAAILIAFAVRLANCAVHETKAHYLRAGTVALVLDENTADPRDILLASCILFNASRRLEIDASTAFSAALTLAYPKRRQLLEDEFCSAPEYVKSLKSMGVELIELEGRLTYVVHLF